MRVAGHLNADQYQAMIAASDVIELINARHGQKGWVFQHDGASPHRAKITRQFLEPLCLTVLSDFHWPANSPDLNVIENLQAILSGEWPPKIRKQQMTYGNMFERPWTI
jgi:hypothetical protein